MGWIFAVSTAMLYIYRERNGNPAFWAEPRNAVSNLAFILAAYGAWMFARRRNVEDAWAKALMTLACVVGVGSFAFHTRPNDVTLWMDILPIATFQLVFFWLLARRMNALPTWASLLTIALVIGVSFALRPIKDPLNGSLFYVAPLLALGWLGMRWAERAPREPYLLVAAAGCFGLALTARTTDWHSWTFGSHFLWHLLNGVVVYLGMRAWMIHCLAEAGGRAESSS